MEAQYYIQLSPYDQVHVFKKSAKGIVHLNLTSYHYNQLEHDWEPGSEDEYIPITEQEFNTHRKSVLEHLNSI